jgi:hypothetical protein
MNKNQELKIKRAESVKGVLDNNTDIVNVTPGLADVDTELGTRIDNAKSLALQQTDTSSPVTKKKNELRGQLETETMNIAPALVAYAGNSSDESLELQVEKFKINKSELGNLRDLQLNTLASAVYQQAAKYADKLAPYVTATEVAAYKTTIDSFDASIPKTKNSQGNGKIITGNLQDAIDGIDDLLNGKIEDLVRPWQNKKVDFYKAFRNAMKLGGIRTGKSKKDKGDGDDTSGNTDSK